MKNIIGICIPHTLVKILPYGLLRKDTSRISFAGVLKDACANIFGWDRVLLEGNNLESRAFREMPDEWWSKRLDIPTLSRYALQYVGTDVLRTHFPDIWVGNVKGKLK